MAKKKTQKKEKKKPSAGQVKLFALLRKHYKANTNTSIDEIVKHTGWKHSTLRTYFGEGHLNQILEVSGSIVAAKPVVVSSTDDELHILISQSPKVRSYTTKLTSELAIALAQKSKEHMYLALEVFNKPTVNNRADAFVILFTVAWEQILKSMLAERDGDEAIFTGSKIHGRRKSIGILDAVDEVFASNKSSSVVKNLLTIKDLRDESVHLLCKDLVGPLSRLFQSGVINFVKFYEDFVGEPFIESGSSGLIALVSHESDIEKSVIVHKYGKALGSEIFSLREHIESSINEYSDAEYAIPMSYSIAITKKEDRADISLYSGSGASASGGDVKIINKIVSDSQVYKYRTNAAVGEINSRLCKLYTKAELVKKGIVDSNGRVRFTSGHFQKMIKKQKWKKSDNIYHKHYSDINLHRYSDAAIDSLMSVIDKADGKAF